MEDKKTVKNKAAKKATINKRESKTFGKSGKDYKEFKIKKDFKNIFVKGDIVYLTSSNEEVYKAKGLI
jgi:hypothetical protein